MAGIEYNGINYSDRMRCRATDGSNYVPYLDPVLLLDTMHVNISCSSDDAAVLMWIINPYI